MREFPKPGPEHQKLRRLTGAWAARITRYRPGEPPLESTGEFLARMDIGGYFLCREVNFGMQGFQGRALTSYDAFQRAYIGTWVDSMSPIIHRTRAQFDDEGTYCETSEGPDADGMLVRHRLTTEILGPNQMLFRMYELSEAGEETLCLRVEHQRRRFVD